MPNSFYQETNTPAVLRKSSQGSSALSPVYPKLRKTKKPFNPPKSPQQHPGPGGAGDQSALRRETGSQKQLPNHLQNTCVVLELGRFGG